MLGLKQKTNLSIYTLAVSILISTVIVTFGLNSTATKSGEVEEPQSSYVLESKYKQDVGVLIKEVIDMKTQIAALQGQANGLEDCVRRTTINLAGNLGYFSVCP